MKNFNLGISLFSVDYLRNKNKISKNDLDEKRKHAQQFQ